MHHAHCAGIINTHRQDTVKHRVEFSKHTLSKDEYNMIVTSPVMLPWLITILLICLVKMVVQLHYMIHFCIARAKAHKEGRFWFYISHSSAKYYMCIISREIILEYLVSSPDLIDGGLISITP